MPARRRRSRARCSSPSTSGSACSACWLPAQVWTLANFVLTTREAKRAFGFIGSGAILGLDRRRLRHARHRPTWLGTENLAAVGGREPDRGSALVWTVWRRSGRLRADEADDASDAGAAGPARQASAGSPIRRYLRSIAVGDLACRRSRPRLPAGSSRPSPRRTFPAPTSWRCSSARSTWWPALHSLVLQLLLHRPRAALRRRRRGAVHRAGGDGAELRSVCCCSGRWSPRSALQGERPGAALLDRQGHGRAALPARAGQPRPSASSRSSTRWSTGWATRLGGLAVLLFAARGSAWIPCR